MRNRLKKKAEKRKRQMIHELLDLVLDINGLNPRKQKLTGNLPTAFFEFNGHVGDLTVRLYPRGWCPRARDNDDIEVTAYTYSDTDLKNAVARLMTVKAEPPGAATPRDSK